VAQSMETPSESKSDNGIATGENRMVQRPAPNARGHRPASTDELCRRTNMMSAARPEWQKLKTRAKPGKWISVQTGEHM
jgi:hypothetical protein